MPNDKEHVVGVDVSLERSVGRSGLGGEKYSAICQHEKRDREACSMDEPAQYEEVWPLVSPHRVRQYAKGLLEILAGVGELVLLPWLPVEGVDSERWYERARALKHAFSEN